MDFQYILKKIKAVMTIRAFSLSNITVCTHSTKWTNIIGRKAMICYFHDKNVIRLAFSRPLSRFQIIDF